MPFKFTGKIEEKPREEQFGSLVKPRSVDEIIAQKKQSTVADIFAPKVKDDSLKAKTDEEIKAEQQKQSEQAAQLKAEAETKAREEASKISTSKTFLDRLSSILGIKKDALKTKDQNTVLKETNDKINEIQANAEANAKKDAQAAADAKLQANAVTTNQKINDLNTRIENLKNNFFSNLSSFFPVITSKGIIPDRFSGRIDKIRTEDTKEKSERLKAAIEKYLKYEHNPLFNTEDTNIISNLSNLSNLSNGISKKINDPTLDAQRAKDDSDRLRAAIEKDLVYEHNPLFKPEDTNNIIHLSDTLPKRDISDSNGRDDANKANNDANRMKSHEGLNERNERETTNQAQNYTLNEILPLSNDENVKNKSQQAQTDAERNRNSEIRKTNERNEREIANQALILSNNENPPLMSEDDIKNKSQQAQNDAQRSKDTTTRIKNENNEKNKSQQAQNDANKANPPTNSKDAKDKADKAKTDAELSRDSEIKRNERNENEMINDALTNTEHENLPTPTEDDVKNKANKANDDAQHLNEEEKRANHEHDESAISDRANIDTTKEHPPLISEDDVKNKAKKAKDDAENEREKEKKPNEPIEKDKTDKAKDDTDKAKLPTNSKDAKDKAQKAKDDTEHEREKEKKPNESDEKDKTDKAKDDSNKEKDPLKDNNDVRDKAQKAKDDAEHEREKEEEKKNEKDEKDKADKAEKDSEKDKPPDDSEHLKEVEEKEKEKEEKEEEKEKEEKDKEDHLKDLLGNLLNLLGLIGTALSITNIVTGANPPPPGRYCDLHPTDPSCYTICTGPLCMMGPIGPTGPTGPQLTGPPPPPQGPAPPPLPGFDMNLFLDFTLQSKPEKDLTISLVPTTEDLVFQTDQIVFHVDTWDTTITVPYYVNLPDISGNDEFNSKSLDEKTSYLTKKTKPRKKQDFVSINAYYPTKQELNEDAEHLKELLDTEDITTTLRKLDTDLETKELEGLINPENEETKAVFSPVKIRARDGGDYYVEPTHDDSDYKAIHQDDEPYEDSDETESVHEDVIPTYDDSQYRIVGGQEDDTPSDNNTSTRSPEDIINDLSNNNVSTSDLSDDHKVYFNMNLVENITGSYDISIVSKNPEYTIDPETVTFTSDISSNEVALFSSETMNTLNNVTQINKANDLTDEFNESVDNKYGAEYQDILNDKDQEDMKAIDVYNETYKNSLQNSYTQLYDAQNVRNQLQSGGFQKYFTRSRSNKQKSNSTRKIK